MTASGPCLIKIGTRDNVAIVTNDGGLAEGTQVSDDLRLREHVPQGHKVALEAIGAGAAVLRYNVTIGYALRDIPAGSWVHEGLLELPAARSLDGLPVATEKPYQPRPCLNALVLPSLWRRVSGPGPHRPAITSSSRTAFMLTREGLTPSATTYRSKPAAVQAGPGGPKSTPCQRGTPAANSSPVGW